MGIAGTGGTYSLFPMFSGSKSGFGVGNREDEPVVTGLCSNPLEFRTEL